MRLAVTLGLLTLAACPPKRGPGGGPAPVGVGCPDANNVYVASYLTPEDGGKGHTGWVLPLHDKVVESVKGVAEYATLDHAAATAAGVPAPPQSVWILAPGVAPCRATIGNYYAAAIDAPTPNLTYGIELTGCQPPPDPSNASAIAAVSADPPSECQVIGPRAVASRLGEIDKQGKWQKPAKETPIPASLAPVIPNHECAAPGCEKLWSIAQVDVGGQPVAWAGAVNWLTVSDECEWKGQRFSGFFVVGPTGAPMKVTEGQDHPLALTAVLADKTGAKVLIAEGPGEYTTYTLGAGTATVGRHLVWLLPHPDSFEALDQLGPVCPEADPGSAVSPPKP
ncbi:MAG: hypothetical protein H0V17_05940 [Deltaproteobacteria bacterium]|nr:hypothetical protein [Deltaproteobacteria bacterium]